MVLPNIKQCGEEYHSPHSNLKYRCTKAKQHQGDHRDQRKSYTWPAAADPKQLVQFMLDQKALSLEEKRRAAIQSDLRRVSECFIEALSGMRLEYEGIVFNPSVDESGKVYITASELTTKGNISAGYRISLQIKKLELT